MPAKQFMDLEETGEEVDVRQPITDIGSETCKLRPALKTPTILGSGVNRSSTAAYYIARLLPVK